MRCGAVRVGHQIFEIRLRKFVCVFGNAPWLIFIIIFQTARQTQIYQTKTIEIIKIGLPGASMGFFNVLLIFFNISSR